MEYMSSAEAAAKWGITARRVQVLCATDRIPGAERLSRLWAIPRDAVKPDDPRRSGLGTAEGAAHHRADK